MYVSLSLYKSKCQQAKMAFSGVIDLKERNCMLCQKCKIKKLLFLDFVLQKNGCFFFSNIALKIAKKISNDFAINYVELDIYAIG